MPPLVSIIIPTYNRAPWVVEAVELVLNQSFQNFELIVVDDGSTDETAPRLAAYPERLRLSLPVPVRRQRRPQPGLSLAAGTWIAFLDSDDLWLPHKLEVQMDFLAQNPEAEICQTEEIWISKTAVE